MFSFHGLANEKIRRNIQLKQNWYFIYDLRQSKLLLLSSEFLIIFPDFLFAILRETKKMELETFQLILKWNKTDTKPCQKFNWGLWTSDTHTI